MSDVLLRASIFQGVDPDAVAALYEQLQPVSFPRGHRVFREGEPGDRLFIITSGTVKIGRTSPTAGRAYWRCSGRRTSSASWRSSIRARAPRR